MLRAPKGRANKAQANGLGLEQDPNLLSEPALKGRNNQELAPSGRSYRNVKRVIAPFQGWRIARRRIFPPGRWPGLR